MNDVLYYTLNYIFSSYIYIRRITMDELLKKIYTNNLSTNTDFLNDLSTLTDNYIEIQKSLQKVYKQQTSFALGEQG